MAKRELSSTLKNLKFMQRAALKEVKVSKEQLEKNKDSTAGDLSTPAPARRCIVIMEGDPHPGAVKGRMSFQSFNPFIDVSESDGLLFPEKVNEEASNPGQPQTNLSSTDQTRKMPERSTCSANDSNEFGSDSEPEVDHKRKQPEADVQPSSPLRPHKYGSEDRRGQPSSRRNRTGSNKQQKREKLDWNVLRPPKAEARKA